MTAPPLRERPDDIPLLAEHFARAFAADMGREPPALTDETVTALRTYGFPGGNVRELKNAAERFVLGIAGNGPALTDGAAVPETGPALDEQVAQFEKHAIEQALKSHKGRVGDTAKALGVPRKTLYLRMRKYRIERDDYR